MALPVASSGSDESSPSVADGARAQFTLKQKLLALFVTWHLVAVTVYVLPYPVYFDEATMNRPETREELHRLFGTLNRLLPFWGSEEKMQTQVLGWTRTYMDGYFAMRKVFEPYLDATGTFQSWNMFAGTPPAYPLVFMVEVFAEGKNGWALFQDLHWGTPDFKATHFRHFEAQGNLAAPGWDRHRQWYAEYWARRWNRLHPEAKARFVRFYYMRQTTPSAARVLAGDNDRREQRVQEFVWPVWNVKD